MIIKEEVQVTKLQYGFFLTAQTAKCRYSQFYSICDVKTETDAIYRFINFYNQFE